MSSPQPPTSAVSDNIHKNDIFPPVSTARVSKRKLEDAIQSLDDAVGSSESIDRPPPFKKAHTTRSLYSTLAKYGIKTSNSKSSTPANETLTKNTPHLTAILTRAATRTRKALPFKITGHASTSFTPPNSTVEYRPSSVPSFLSRLATFKLSTYSNKPEAIDAVAASKCGWVNDGKDRLVCGICNVSWVVTGNEGMSRDAANTLIEKQKISLVDMHKAGCPWKTKQCDPSIYRIPLQAPAVMAREVKSNAITLESVLVGVDVKHPLTSNQISSLRSAMSTSLLTSPFVSEEPEMSQTASPGNTLSTPSSQVEPSEAATLTSLFGWSLAPAAPERPNTTSLSRATSALPCANPTPTASRSSTILSTGNDGDIIHLPTPRPRPLPLNFTVRSSPTPSERGDKRDTSLLHCMLCQRRVGLWAFAPPKKVNADSVEVNRTTRSPARPQRQFDLLKEHRSHCPYVVRSTIVPSPPVAQAHPSHTRCNSSSLSLSNVQGAVEGWRAVLTILVRFGMGQRQRMGMGLNVIANGTRQDGADEDDVDGVESMMEGVKSRGGKDLLKYIRGLLS